MSKSAKKEPQTKKESGAYKSVVKMLWFIFKNEPLLMLSDILSTLLVRVPWMISNVVLLRYIINIYSSGENVGRIYTACIAFAILIVVGNLADKLAHELYLPICRERLNKKLYMGIYDKASRMDLACYDDPKFYNEFVLAMDTMKEKVERIMDIARIIATELVSTVTVISVMLTIDPVCVLLVFVCLAFMLPFGKVIANLSLARTKAMTPLDRKNLYYWRVFYLADYQKELRLNPAGEMIERRYDNNIKDRLDTITYYLKRQWKLCFTQEALPQTVVVYLFSSLYMGYRAIVADDILSGDFAAAFNGIMAVTNSLFGLTTWMSRALREEGLYIGKYYSFMDAPETIKGGDEKEVFSSPVRIEFKNVSFTYPGGSKPVLKNISFTVEPYEKIALVGYNGAGKTTLTNLLLRLYDVTEGEISVDGRNIKDWDIDAYHENFAAVFQDYALFGATLAENVAMDSEYDGERVSAALSQAGFDKELENGVQTVLLREFDEDGKSFSGGESQKIAVARAFYKKCAFAVLDEPSANLDPQAEYALNDAMKRAAHDKTVIFISHRLSTTVMADRIFMLENGELVESGSHRSLMEKNGKYAYMFRLQASKYKTQSESAAPKGGTAHADAKA